MHSRSLRGQLLAILAFQESILRGTREIRKSALLRRIGTIAPTSSAEFRQIRKRIGREARSIRLRPEHPLGIWRASEWLASRCISSCGGGGEQRNVEGNVLSDCHSCDRFLIGCGQFDIPSEAVRLLLLLLLLLLRPRRGRMHLAPGVRRDYVSVSVRVACSMPEIIETPAIFKPLRVGARVRAQELRGARARETDLRSRSRFFRCVSL